MASPIETKVAESLLTTDFGRAAFETIEAAKPQWNLAVVGRPGEERTVLYPSFGTKTEQEHALTDRLCFPRGSSFDDQVFWGLNQIIA